MTIFLIKKNYYNYSLLILNEDNYLSIDLSKRDLFKFKSEIHMWISLIEKRQRNKKKYFSRLKKGIIGKRGL